MNDYLHLRKQLAALAFFRILFSKRKNSYEVLRCFIENTLANHSMRLFTVADLLQKLDEDYGFGSLPVFVVEKAVQPLVSSHTQKGYTCDVLPVIEPGFSSSLNESDDAIQDLLCQLYLYIEQEKETTLSDAEKRKFDKALSDFLLTSRAEDDDSLLISRFILDNEKDSKIQSALNEMREGVILYRGLSYSSSKNASDKWKSKMTVYLDTELLFHACGLNGALCKKVFDDFMSLVNEVNTDCLQKQGNRRIYFKCFDYVGKEVDSVFKNAIDIVEGKATLPPGKTAQELLVQGVEDSSEIIRKRVEFDDTIKQLGIEADDQQESYYETSNYAFNLEDASLVDSLREAIPEEFNISEKKIMDSLQSLNFVNVRRKKYSPTDFERSRFILLTENNTTKRIAFSPKIKAQGIVPLCTDLFYFTNRLWVVLGKGFDSTSTPAIFAAANKARFIIASKLDMIVSDEYEKVCADYEAGKLTEDQASSFLYRLKQMAKKPEDVDGSDTVELSLSLNGGILERHLQEQALKDAEYLQTKQRFSAQHEVVSKYEIAEAKQVFHRDYSAYKGKRNQFYGSALCDARRNVSIIVLLISLAILLSTLLSLLGKGFWVSFLGGFSSLLPGLIWSLIRSQLIKDSFCYVFKKDSRIKLKRSIINQFMSKTYRPSYLQVLAKIKEKNGSI